MGIRKYIFINLSRIHVELQDFGMLCEFLGIACNPVAETDANPNQQIAFADPIVGCLGAVHPQHPGI